MAEGAATLPVKTPVGFAVKEVTDAAGVVLVDARDRVLAKVLYTFSGDFAADQRVCEAQAKECPAFVPVEASQLAISNVPDWTIVDRRDGIRQWAYKGQPLYSYDGDRVIGDVHGVNQDPRWQLASVNQHYWPPNVGYRDDQTQGKLLTTDKGFTLYARDLNAFITIGTRVAHDYPYRPRVGRMTRNDPCLEACEKKWKPYLAPAGAQPTGYWGVNLLPNGKRQWTYKDFALFTYVGDKQPGDNFGNMIYEIHLSDDPNVDNEVGYPSLYKSGFKWGVARF
jgi:predicted lipoprotein with Yx(FWY)xxD motif